MWRCFRTDFSAGLYIRGSRRYRQCGLLFNENGDCIMSKLRKEKRYSQKKTFSQQFTNTAKICASICYPIPYSWLSSVVSLLCLSECYPYASRRATRSGRKGFLDDDSRSIYHPFTNTPYMLRLCNTAIFKDVSVFASMDVQNGLQIELRIDC